MRNTSAAVQSVSAAPCSWPTLPCQAVISQTPLYPQHARLAWKQVSAPKSRQCAGDPAPAKYRSAGCSTQPQQQRNPFPLLSIAANSNLMSCTTTTATCMVLLAASFTCLLHWTQRPRLLQHLHGLWLEGIVPGKRRVIKKSQRALLPTEMKSNLPVLP